MKPLRRLALWLAKHLDAFGRVSEAAPYVFAPMSDEQSMALWKTMTRAHDDARYRDAVTVGLASSGLPATSADSFNIGRCGKTHEVLHHAFDYLGIENQLETVGDMIRFLTEHA